MWEREKLPETGGMAPREPGRSGGLTCPFSPRRSHAAVYFLTGSAVMFSKYRSSRPFLHLRRPSDANSFFGREHTLASGYGD